MFLQTPHISIRHLVHQYRVITFTDDPVFLQPWVISPTGYNSLAVLISPAIVTDLNTKDRFSARIRFSGQNSKVKYFKSTGGFNSEILIDLKPGAAYELFGIPLYHFKDSWVELDDFISDTRDLYSRLDESYPDVKKMVPVIDKWLAQRYAASNKKCRKELIHVMELIKTSRGQMDVIQLQRAVGMSRVSLQELFRREVGLSPKLYSRIIRANNVYNAINKMTHLDWMEIVHDFRFFDQAHFIKDFKHFFGRTPNQLHKEGFYFSQYLENAK
ncbi:hypothetical protein CNR22_02490 [Sphingobacteriaceae bacterium]|nr:hypothetical protein CNR22_02490 [Sphingobacteriaceae bacterium]